MVEHFIGNEEVGGSIPLDSTILILLIMAEGKFQNVRGTKDLFGDDIEQFNNIIDIAKKIAQNYCFSELQTPIFEFSEVFERNLGQDSDILTKEVYKFKDRSDNYLTLRPEFTAAIVRSYIANGQLNQIALQKFFSFGPIFRYDRPQKGRQRQFHQINYEIFGAKNHYCDVEMIIMAQEILAKLAISDQAILKINHLGCAKTKEKYAVKLQQYFTKYRNDLSQDSIARLETNPLRILDSKNQQDQALFVNAPKIKQFYSPESKDNLQLITDLLDEFNIKYQLDQNLVRGLDYYSGLVFEFVNDHDGAQNTILAGGRYDNLVAKMSGNDVAAIGFAAGVERLMMMTQISQIKKRPIAVNYISDNEKLAAFKIADFLRKHNYICDYSFAGNFKRQMKKLGQKNCQFAIIIGENEVKSQKLMIKNLDQGVECEIANDDLLNFLSKNYENN